MFFGKDLDKEFIIMKVILCLAVLSIGGAFGRGLSSLGKVKEWQNHRKHLDMMDRVGEEETPPFPTGDPYITDNVHYYLYTNEEESPYEITKNDREVLKSSTFDPSKKTKILIHGFWSNYQRSIDKELSAAYLASQDVNTIAVDWSKLAKAPLYNVAADNTLPVGKEVAQLIDFLVSAGGANVSDIHILGHSLGAHVAGFAANNIKTGRITRISGLDAARPLFTDRPPSLRLDPTDADIVDCIHTCGKYLGFYEPLCTHDFYPNGGKPIQPGCGLDWDGSCSHNRAFILYASSIEGNTFRAQACSNFQELDDRSCSGGWTGLLGEQAPSTAPGLYLLRTTSDYPYNE